MVARTVRFDLGRYLVLGTLIIAGACGNETDYGDASQVFNPNNEQTANMVFANGGFETGALAPWTLTAYLNNTGLSAAPFPPTTVNQLQLTSGVGVPNTFVDTNGTQQPLLGLTAGAGVPTWPEFGSYTAVINRTAVGNYDPNGTRPPGADRNVNRLTQMSVTSYSDVDPSDSQVHVRFAMAPAMQAAGHVNTNQPYFFILLTDIPTTFSGQATTASATTLTDSTKAWTAAALVGQTAFITTGTGAGEQRVITANTPTQLTVAAWPTTPDTTSSYSITPNGGVATGGSTTTLNVVGSPWTVNQWVGWTLYVTAGTDSAQQSTITANTANQLTVSPALTAAPDATSYFLIGNVVYTNFNFANQPGVPWLTQVDTTQGALEQVDACDILYTPWQTIDIAPGNSKLAPGDTVQLAIYVAGCQQLGHWAEVYVDGFGASLPTLGVAKTAWQATNIDTNITYKFSVRNSTGVTQTNVTVNETLPYGTTFVSLSAPGTAACTSPAVGGSGVVSCNLGTMSAAAYQNFTVTVLNYAPGTSFSSAVTSGTATTLSDANKAWTAGALVGQTVLITSGTGAGEQRVITANTANQLTVATWPTTPDATSQYTLIAPALSATGTASSGTATSLTDLSKTWTTNEWVGWTVYITAGAGVSASNIGQQAIIASNTGTVLTLIANASWTTGNTAPGQYIIINAPTVSGTATAAGTRTTLIDGNKNWPINSWVGWNLSDSSLTEQGVVISNTATTLTVGANMATATANGNKYTLSRPIDYITNGNYTISATGVAAMLGPRVNTNLTTGVAYADLAITKTDNLAAVGWNGSASYTIVVTNNGPVAVNGATVTDTIPAQLTGASWTCSASAGSSCGSTATLSTPVSLLSGGTATFVLNANVVNGSGTGTLSNLATVTAPSGVVDPDSTNNGAVDIDGIGSQTAVTVNSAAAETGYGYVSSAPAGITCGTATCNTSTLQCCTSPTSGNFVSTYQLVLTAIARTGDTLTGWTGGQCNGVSTNACSFNVPASADTETANFRGPMASVTVTGSGSASCPLTGTAQGQNITCTFTPSAGQIVTVLTDGGINKMASLVSLPGPQYSYTMVASNTGDRSIAVTFGAGTTYSLTVNAAAGNTGYGYVTSTPSGVISCGASGCSTPGTCCSTASALLDATYGVTLTSTARTGDTFTGWTGGQCNGVATPACMMTMPASADTETATYRGPMANVTITGSGSASCPLTGTLQGQNITCTFTPGPGQIVTVLTDGGINKMGSLVSLPGPQYSYTMVAGISGDHSIAVTFGAGTTYSLTVNAAAGNTGYGYVTSTPSGVVSCGASGCSTPGTCCSTTSALLDATYAVTLTSTARAGDTFTGWTGGKCNGVATPACTMTMPASADTETANIRGPIANVTVTGSGSASCPLTGTTQGQNITCTFTPGPGQIVTVLTDGGINKMGSLVSLPGPQYSYTLVASNTGDRSIAVTFAAGTTYSLTVNAAAGNTGYGYVTSTPSGVVSCGASGCSTPGTCCSTASALLDATYGVTLTSTARAGDTFTGWTGGKCNGVATPACTMTMPASADTETANIRGPIANVTVTGSGSASCPLTGTLQGQNITCTFTPGPGQIVTVLTDGGINKMGSLVSLPGPQYSYTMVASNSGDHSIAVTFAAGTTYSLTVNAAAGDTGYGYVTSTPSGVVGCGASGCSTPGTCCSTASALLDATYGLQLTSTPRTGDTFAGWTGGQCNGVATPACTLTMPASADTETANFRGPKATVTVSGSNGTASCPAAGVSQGQNITCTFTPSFGYVVGSLTDNGTNKLGSVVAGAAPTYTYTMVADNTGDHTLVVSFASAGASYSLTVGTASPETGYGYLTSNSTPAVTCGTITCNSSTASCCNSPVATPFYATYGLTLTATARTGDTFTGWTGGRCNGVLTNACTMLMPASADAETAYFRGPIATVTVSGSNGIASCPGAGVAQGQNITCTFTPSFGYLVGSLTDNGTNKLGSVVAGAAPTYTYTMVADSTGDHTLVVSFASAGASYSLTVGSASPETGFGYVTSNSTPAVTCGTSTCNSTAASCCNSPVTTPFYATYGLTLTATARTGDTFTGWTGGQCDSVIATACTMLMPASADTETANFRGPKATVTVSGSNGTASCPATGVAQGQNITCTFTPSFGYVVGSLTDNGINELGSVVAGAAPTYTYTMVADNTGDHTLVVSFAGAGASYSLTVGSATTETGYGYVTSNSTPAVTCGTSTCNSSTASCCNSPVATPFYASYGLTLTATARTGDTFIGWTGGRCNGVLTNACTMLMPAGADTETANFRGPIATAIVASGAISGTASCQAGSFPQGSDIPCTITPAATPSPGYMLESLIDNGIDVTALVSGTAYTITNVAVDHILIATFDPLPEIITSAPTAAGETLSYSYTGAASDVNGAALLSWSVVAGTDTCGGVIASGTSTYSFTPFATTPTSPCNVVIEVCDSAVIPACATQITAVTVERIPLTAPVTLSTNVNLSVQGPVGAITANDTPGESSLVLAILAVGPIAGTTLGAVVLNPDNSVTYTPPNNFVGTDSFTVTVADNGAFGLSATGTVYVNVTDLPPVFSTTNLPIPNAGQGTLYTYSASATDVGGTLPIVWSMGAGDTCGGGMGGAGGNVYTFTPGAIVSCVMSVQVCDSATPPACATQQTTIAVNQSPVISTLPPLDVAVTKTFDYAPSETDPDGPGATWSRLGTDTCAGSINAATGEYTFAATGAVGTTCTLAIQVCDGGVVNECTVQTTTITYVANPPPVAVNDAALVDEDGTVAITVLGNDSDPNGLAMTVVAVTTPLNGTAVINPDNTVQYTAGANFTGVDTFDYTITDAFGGLAIAQVSVTVYGPVFSSAAPTQAGQGVVYTYNAVAPDTYGPSPLTWSVAPSDTCGGSMTGNEYTFTPGAIASCVVAVQVCDAGSPPGCATQQTTVVVNQAPVISTIPASQVAVGGTYNYAPINVDPDGPSATWSILNTDSCGGSINATTGEYTFAAVASLGAICTMAIQICDEGTPYDECTLQQTTVTYVANAPPLAENDSATVYAGSSIDIDVLANDSDPNGLPMMIVSITAAPHGTATINSNNTVHYTPDIVFMGVDTFTYTVADADGGSATASVSVTVKSHTPGFVPGVAVVGGGCAASSQGSPLAAVLLLGWGVLVFVRRRRG